MGYEEAYDNIAKFANDQLKYFADGWSRMPNGDNAVEISQNLRARARACRAITPVISRILLQTADGLEKAAGIINERD